MPNLYWLVVEPYPSEKYEFVSWEYSSQYMGKNVPNHQPVSMFYQLNIVIFIAVLNSQ
jgi:hypothetical protein